jgi:hypothetical protein
VTERPKPDRERVSSFAGRDDLFNTPDDSLKAVDEWNSLQAYLVGEIGIHVHLKGFRPLAR